jgi:hypothetical protein
MSVHRIEQIEQEIARLSPEEQALLMERLTQRARRHNLPLAVLAPAKAAPAKADKFPESLQPAIYNRRSALEILDAAPGHRLFQTAAEVEHYLREERASWDG